MRLDGLIKVVLLQPRQKTSQEQQKQSYSFAKEKMKREFCNEMRGFFGRFWNGTGAFIY